MNIRGLLIFSLIVLLAVLVSCSGSSSPVTPGTHADSPGLTARESSMAGSSHVLWGLWEVAIDSSTGTVDAVPLRTAEFNANVTNFLQPPFAPINLMKLTIHPTSDLPGGYVDCDITLEHPFKALPQYRGFDVRGIFMADGSLPVESVSGLTRAASDEARLLNADGYTRWWNSSEFGPDGTIFGFQFGKLGPQIYPTATLNPYKYFADDLDDISGVETLDPITRGTFGNTPGLNTRNYQLQFTVDGGPVFKFQYAIDAAWDEPDPAFEPDYPIESFPESAQMREPFHMMLMDAGSTAYYENETSKGGEFKFAIEVFDWQMPDDGPGLEISALYLEADAINGPVDVLLTAVELPGSSPVSRIYSVVLDDLNLTQAGEEEILIAAISSEGTYEPNLEGGAPGFIYPDEPLAAFTLGTAHVLGEPMNMPPVAIADDSWLLEGYAPLTFHMDPTGSYDPDEPSGDYIALYEWDIDADGTYEYSNTDGEMIKHVFMDAGTHYVQLRVTDSFGATGLLDEPLELNLIPDTGNWPQPYQNANNTAYNEDSTVSWPLSLVYDQTFSGNNHAMLTVARGKVYMTASNGWMRVFDSDTGDLEWSKQIKPTSGGYWTGCAPALWLDNVSVGGTGIWQFNGDLGYENWHVFTSAGYEHQGQVIADDTIFFKGTGSYSMVGVDPEEGMPDWSVSWSSHPLFPPVYGEVADQGYVLAPRYSSARCVNTDDGGLEWEQPVGGSIYHPPLVLGDYVYYGVQTLYKTNMATGSHDATYSLSPYQPLGMWSSPDDIFVVTRWYDGSYHYQLMSFDHDINLNWEIDIPYSCEQGVYSDGYVYLAMEMGSGFQMVAFDATDGSQDYVHPTTFSTCWGGITNAYDRLYIADNYGHLLCFESE